MESRASMFLAKVVRCNSLAKAVRVSVQNMVLDSNLNVYFNKEDQLWAADPDSKYGVGDLVIVKKLAQRQTVDINHFVAEMVFQCGNVIDPVTGRRCRGSRYIDESRRTFNKLDLVDKLQSALETKTSAK